MFDLYTVHVVVTASVTILSALSYVPINAENKFYSFANETLRRAIFPMLLGMQTALLIALIK